MNKFKKGDRVLPVPGTPAAPSERKNVRVFTAYGRRRLDTPGTVGGTSHDINCVTVRWDHNPKVLNSYSENFLKPLAAEGERSADETSG